MESVARTESKRIEALDLARGFAVALMILSHGVKGLLPFESFTSWGLVPIHLITKFSSSLFFIVFGISLSVVFTSYVGTAKWPDKRAKLFLRGLTIFFWYKVLTIVEMFQFQKPDAILNTLLYGSFTSFVEILGFYAIALLWIPFALPLWNKLAWWGKWLSPLIVFLISTSLYWNFDFFESETLKALLVENEGYYTWGQLARLPLVLLGMILGDYLKPAYEVFKERAKISGVLLAVSIALFIAFVLHVQDGLSASLSEIAMNDGKHPPESTFMMFSMGGAALLLAIAILGGRLLSQVLYPFTLIGLDALQAFIFHISVIFVVYRFLLGYWNNVSYEEALMLTISLLLLTALWIWTVSWIKKLS